MKLTLRNTKSPFTKLKDAPLEYKEVDENFLHLRRGIWVNRILILTLAVFAGYLAL